MAENTKIQWCSCTRVDGTKTPGYTWSPWRGCAKKSTGCRFCYAEKLSHRNPAVLGEWGVGTRRPINAAWTKPLAWDRHAAKMGERHKVFPSLCDPFEDREDLDASRSAFLELIAQTPNLEWLILTKRPECWEQLMRRIAFGFNTDEGGSIAAEWLDGKPLPNLWLGVSVENQEFADERLPIASYIPAAVHWVSYEPALEQVDFTQWIDAIDWIVCGGESESKDNARPFYSSWARSARDQCKAAGVAFYMKQFGSTPVGFNFKDPKGGNIDEFPEDLRIREFPAAV